MSQTLTTDLFVSLQQYEARYIIYVCHVVHVLQSIDETNGLRARELAVGGLLLALAQGDGNIARYLTMKYRHCDVF